MISVFTFFISAISTFFFPLFLTYKALSQDVNSSQKLQQVNLQLQFLVNYWISYVLIIYLENLFQQNLITGILEQNAITSITFLVIRLWLLFSHGCLIVNRIYGDVIGSILVQQDVASEKQQPRKRELQLFDKIEYNLDPLCKAMINSITSILIVSGFARVSIVYNLVNFREYMLKNPQLTFLQASLNYLCFIDSPAELAERYNNFHLFIKNVNQPRRKTSPQHQQHLQHTQQQTLPLILPQDGPQPSYALLAQVKVRSANPSRHSSRSGSNKMVGEIFTPERFSVIDYKDAPTFSRSPSPAPAPKISSHKLNIGDVHTPLQYKDYLDFQQKLKEGKVTPLTQVRLQQSTPPNAQPVAKCVSEQLNLNIPQQLPLDQVYDHTRSASYDTLNKDIYVVHNPNTTKTGAAHLQPPSHIAPPENYIILPRRNRLSSQPAYPQ